MLVVQFGRQVIDEINALPTSGLTDQMALGDAQGAYHQLLLTPGQNVHGVVAIDAQP